jgi:hypothetical protein
VRTILYPDYEIMQEKKKKWRVDVTFFLYIFWTTAWAFFSIIKIDLNDIFFQLFVQFPVYLIN